MSKLKAKVFKQGNSKSEVNVFPLGNAVYIDLYDTGSATIPLGKGKNAINFITLADNTFGQDTRWKHTEKHPGIRDRWCRVIATNAESEKTVQIGDKVLTSHLAWSAPCPVPGHMEKKFYRLEVEKIIGIDDDGFTEQEMTTIKNRQEGAWLGKKK